MSVVVAFVQLIVFSVAVACGDTQVTSDLMCEQQPDAKTLAAYRMCGGMLIGAKVDSFGYFKEQWEGIPTGCLPVFAFGKLSNGRLPELPLVNIRFGLQLSMSNVRDMELKKLIALKNLIYLNLGGNRITD